MLNPEDLANLPSTTFNPHEIQVAEIRPPPAQSVPRRS